MSAKQTEMERLWKMMAEVEVAIQSASSTVEKKALGKEMIQLHKHYQSASGLPSAVKHRGYIGAKDGVNRLIGKTQRKEHPTRDSINEKLPRGIDESKW